jgi:hypothetical protein
MKTDCKDEIILPSGDKVEVGKAYRISIANGTGNIYKAHVLAIVEGNIVYKYYGVHKQWWHYEIDHPIRFGSHMDIAKRNLDL